MRTFGPRISAYAFWTTTDIHTDIHYTKYSTLPSGISAYIVPKVGIFTEAGGRGKYSLPRVQYMPIFHKEGFWIFSLLHKIFSTRNYCIRSDVPIDHAQYQGWNIGMEHRNIFHPYEPIWLVRFTRLCNKYIYLYHGSFKPTNQIAQFEVYIFHIHLLSECIFFAWGQDLRLVATQQNHQSAFALK